MDIAPALENGSSVATLIRIATIKDLTRVEFAGTPVISMLHAGFETLGTTMHGNMQYAVLI
jgi:hypothetical protein